MSSQKERKLHENRALSQAGRLEETLGSIIGQEHSEQIGEDGNSGIREDAMGILHKLPVRHRHLIP